jgi:hypothetical protein
VFMSISSTIHVLCIDIGAQQAGSRAATGGLTQQLVTGPNTSMSENGDAPANASGQVPKDTKFGLLGLLDVIKMTDRVLYIYASVVENLLLFFSVLNRI